MSCELCLTYAHKFQLDTRTLAERKKDKQRGRVGEWESGRGIDSMSSVLLSHKLFSSHVSTSRLDNVA